MTCCRASLRIVISLADRSACIGQQIINNISGYFGQDKTGHHIMQAPRNLIEQGGSNKFVDRLCRAELDDQAPER